MSTCPEPDIHSVYLDNELAGPYAAAYEAHLTECPSCAAEYARLKAVHDALAADSRSCTLSERDVEAGYDRLLSRLSYSKVSARAAKASVLPFESVMKYAVGAAAAALVVVFALPRRPVQVQEVPVVQVQMAPSFEPVARTSLSAPLNAQVQIDAPLSAAILGSDPGIAPLPAGPVTVAAFSPYRMELPADAAIPVLDGQGPRYAVRQTVNSSSSLACYDIFTPLPDEIPAERHQKGVSFHFTTPLASFSFEIGGSGN